MLTDRDIVLKVVAAGRDPGGTAVSEVMTTDPVSVPAAGIGRSGDGTDGDSRQVRRIPIVDKDGAIVGIVSQADIATRFASPQETGQVVQAISEPVAT